MNRPWQIWTAFALCLAVVLSALGYISTTALKLDHAQAAARKQADLEERVQLALWRMDSALAPLIAQENARPYFQYSPFYPAERAYTRMFARIGRGEVLVPSPLLDFASPYIEIHFQLAPDSSLTSPQVPTGRDLTLVQKDTKTGGKIKSAALLLDQTKTTAQWSVLAKLLPPDSLPSVSNRRVVMREGDNFLNQMSPGQPSRNRSQNEWQARSIQQLSANVAQIGSRGEPLTPANVREGVMRPIWVGNILLLARRVSVEGKDYIQGCQLNWPTVKTWLLGNIKDLLPAADLVGIQAPTAHQETRILAALPVRLIPGPITAEPDESFSPIRITLLIAWAGMLLAALAVAVLLRGAVMLSERRGAFVSAVTHELRTPLTTFRMYSEMLEKNMVPSEEKRKSYLRTLCREADRLAHLVENVLAYARLERTSPRRKTESVTVTELLGRMEDRFSEHVRQANMTLTVEVDPEIKEARLATDVSAVEQILFNLLDNARKYAAPAEDRRIHLSVNRENSFVTFRVRDHGPGISNEDRKRLFQPFRKSSRQAANSAPGVGLGLALSRRLAREMGGKLEWDKTISDGAAFVLHLPAQTGKRS
jgi:signal transduction histidine kinase